MNEEKKTSCEARVKEVVGEYLVRMLNGEHGGEDLSIFTAAAELFTRLSESGH